MAITFCPAAEALTEQRSAELRELIRAAGYVPGQIVRSLRPIDTLTPPEVLFIGYEREGADKKARPLRALLPVRRGDAVTVAEGW